MTTQSPEELPRLGAGLPWEQIAVGKRMRTFARTLTETDLVNFIALSVFVEPMFREADRSGGAITGRPVPAALTYSIIEGLLISFMIQGTALAFLECSMKAEAPVRVGDTVHATFEVTDLRPTSKGGRAVMTTDVEVWNQNGERVLSYQVRRLIAGAQEAGVAPA